MRALVLKTSPLPGADSRDTRTVWLAVADDHEFFVQPPHPGARPTRDRVVGLDPVDAAGRGQGSEERRRAIRSRFITNCPTWLAISSTCLRSSVDIPGSDQRGPVRWDQARALDLLLGFIPASSGSGQAVRVTEFTGPCAHPRWRSVRA